MNFPKGLSGNRVRVEIPLAAVLAGVTGGAVLVRWAGLPPAMAASISIALAGGLVLAVYGALRARRLKEECAILRDQLEKSALIVSKQQEKEREAGEKIDTLHHRILLSKQQLESTFDAISDGICVLGSDLSIQRVNRAYAKMVNTPIRDLLGRKCYQVFWEARHPCDNCPTIAAMKTGNIRTGSALTKTKEERNFHYEISAFPVRDDKGNVVNVIESIHDVTEQRHMGDQLIRSEKLATIGIMTAGIAHEMNNPLSGISGNVANMLEMPDKYGLNERGVHRLGSMLEAAQRATRIMRSLLDLSRRTERQLIFADVNEIVSNAISRIHLPGYNAIVKDVQMHPKLAPVQCDPGQIEQVLINILTNAYYAILEKREALKKQQNGGANGEEFIGRIAIQTSENNGHALVVVEDNGTGLTEEKKRHLFDPFYTTRPPGKGTGLGLSISHKIIEEHEGRIWGENGRSGAQFSLELPFHRSGQV